MPNYDFNKDLLVAKKTEEDVAKLLESFGVKILEYNDDNRYDIKVDWKGNIKTIEIKEDFLCQETGNVAVEFSCRGNDSGIKTTQSDFYIYKVHEVGYIIHYYLMKTSDLKKIISDKSYHRTVNGGDEGSNSLNYLFFLSTIRNISLLLK